MLCWKVVSYNRMRTIDKNNIVDILQEARRPHRVPYFSFYSSLWDGITYDPSLMVVPVDDHLVHRGDGVFESFKCVNGAAYNFDAHLERLERSAQGIGLAYLGGIVVIREKVLEVLRETAEPNCTVRILLSRGPGGMGVSPKESIGAVLTIVVYGLGTPFMQSCPQGARVRKSLIPVKPPMFATIKHCNYLPNVLMKGEAEALNVDFMIGVDVDGFITECPTENIGIVSKSGHLVFPLLGGILAGTTMLRVVELARQLEVECTIKGVAFRAIHEDELYEAQEVLITGTTLDVVSVVEYNDRPIGHGSVGAISEALNLMLAKDITDNPVLRTLFM